MLYVWAGTGEIFGPKLFEEFAVKYINRIIDAIHEENIPAIVHICGQMKKVYPQLNMIKSDVGTGILPEEVKDKLVYAGNASKTGAYMALMSVDVKEKIEELAHKMDYLELGATEKDLNSTNSKLYRYIKLCFCYNINF